VNKFHYLDAPRLGTKNGPFFDSSNSVYPCPSRFHVSRGFFPRALARRRSSVQIRSAPPVFSYCWYLEFRLFHKVSLVCDLLYHRYLQRNESSSLKDSLIFKINIWSSFLSLDHNLWVNQLQWFLLHTLKSSFYALDFRNLSDRG